MELLKVGRYTDLPIRLTVFPVDCEDDFLSRGKGDRLDSVQSVRLSVVDRELLISYDDGVIGELTDLGSSQL